MNLFVVDLKIFGILLFLLSVVGMVTSAILLFIDVTLSLKALQIGVNEYLD
jgi:hypothetical protein